MIYTNQTGLPLSVAVFLATDSYDKDTDTVSATALLKPLRQLILTPRVSAEDASVDVLNMLKSRVGSAIHDGIEYAWKNNYKQALESLGYPKGVRESIVINPTTEQVEEGCIPVYLEQRASKVVNGIKITGKYDFIADGVIEDFKSTGTFTYVNDTKSNDYILQGSIYRWLNPDKVTSSILRIVYIFMDWNTLRAKTDPNYPKQSVMAVEYPLMSLQETENFVINKLNQFLKLKDAPEEQLPLCTDKELWRKDPVWKYYRDPNKTARSTKNFDSKQDAYIRLAKDGGNGLIIEKPGEVVACKYCPAFMACSQKDKLIEDGSLTL